MNKQPVILVVEDENFILQLLCDVLETEGFRVLSARNGLQACTLLQHSRPDIILSDIMMPEMDGYQLLKKVQELPTLRSIPFLFLTSKDQLEDRIKGLDIGADDYIVKPFDIQELIARIKIRLQRKQDILNFAVNSKLTVQGDLETMPLLDILQHLAQREATGKLNLNLSQGEAAILLNKGKLVHLEYLGYKGKRAFLYILDEPGGSFTFTEMEAVEGKELSPDTQKLILEWVEYHASYTDLVKTLPSLDTRCIVTSKVEETSFSAQTLTLLALFDGERTLQQILRHAERDDLITIQLLRELIDAGVIMPISETD